MGTILASIALVIMIGYLIYLTTSKPTKSNVFNRMYICIGLIIWCIITAITYFIEGKTGNGCIWIFNSSLWVLNYYTNNKYYKSISEYESMNNTQDKQTIRKKKLERILSGNPFKSTYESFINWLKK